MCRDKQVKGHTKKLCKREKEECSIGIDHRCSDVPVSPVVGKEESKWPPYHSDDSVVLIATVLWLPMMPPFLSTLCLYILSISFSNFIT